MVLNISHRLPLTNSFIKNFLIYPYIGKWTLEGEKREKMKKTLLYIGDEWRERKDSGSVIKVEGAKMKKTKKIRPI